MAEELISIGIDIGTTTTQVIFSKMTIADRGNYFTAPEAEIIRKEILYRGKIYFTPLKDQDLIDAAAIKRLIQMEYESAGLSKEQIQTGAAIVTGESSRKQNAETVLTELAGFAGDFVVAAAGPDLESVIAGKGAGAFEYSKTHHCVVANLDIGGGTTNIVIFDQGRVARKTCLNIGGRLIKAEKGGRITYIAPSVQKVLTKYGIHLLVGEEAEKAAANIKCCCSVMADLLAEVLFSEKESDCDLFTAGSDRLNKKKKIDFLSFSGGVAALMDKKSKETNPEEDKFQYGDIGEFLAEAIGEQKEFQNRRCLKGLETIRATVIGAGMHTMELSGSTIYYTESSILPQINLPVLCLEENLVNDVITGEISGLKGQIMRFLKEYETEKFAFSLGTIQQMPYRKIKKFAENLILSCEALWMEERMDRQIVIMVNADMAKVLGQTITMFAPEDILILSVDKVLVNHGDYVDFGKPVMNGSAIPVVVKTLIFG